MNDIDQFEFEHRSEKIVLGEIDATKCPMCHETYEELDQWFADKTRKIDGHMGFICGNCTKRA